MFKVFFTHYILCFIGASIRFIYLKLKNLNKTNTNVVTFKELWNYKHKPDVEMLDAIMMEKFGLS